MNCLHCDATPSGRYYLLWYTWRGRRVFSGDSRGMAVRKFSALAL